MTGNSNDYKYPIYHFSFYWTQDDEEYPTSSTGFTDMKRTEMSQEELDDFSKSWWDDYISKPIRGKEPIVTKNPKLTKVESKYVEHETWCLMWFNHYSFNVHLTDEELRWSFWKYVDRKRGECRERGDYNGDGLMGAVDEWRWKDPCRCDGCVSLGRVIITH